MIEDGVIQIVVPNASTRIKAIEMDRVGNKKNGYPELTDVKENLFLLVPKLQFENEPSEAPASPPPHYLTSGTSVFLLPQTTPALQIWEGLFVS